MKRPTFLLPFLAFALPALITVPVDSLAIERLIAQSPREREEKVKRGPQEADISIKEVDPRNGLVFNKIIPAKEGSQDSFVYYDKDYRGQGCVTSCDKYDGLVVKWTSFYLQIQPYEKKCLFICHTSFPMPSRSIKVFADKKEFEVELFDDFEYIYYLPMEVRDALKQSSSFTIQVAGVGLSTYSPSEQAIVDIKEVLNADKELSFDSEKPGESIRDRLVEIKGLLEDGFISEDEYESMRKKALGL